jgi:hypothetical protein
MKLTPYERKAMILAGKVASAFILIVTLLLSCDSIENLLK